MALLELKNISRRFGNLDAVKDVALCIEAGEFFTLLDGRSLAGVSPEKRPLHTVLQSYVLFQHITVAGNANAAATPFIRPEIAAEEGLFPPPQTLARLEMLRDFEPKMRRALSRM